MANEMTGKRVLITGASEGIGRAAARLFVEAGAGVLAVARNAERLQQLAEELGGLPIIETLVGDVADGASMDAMARRVLETGDPDVIVANAGIGMDARFARTSDEAMQRVLEVNVTGVLRTVRPFLPGMVRRGTGRIVIVSSVVGKRGIPNYAAYSASKFALHGMADALRSELLGTGVSVGLICPSSTQTQFHGRKLRQGPPQSDQRLARHSAESVARAIVKLAGSRRREQVLSAEGKLIVWANRFLPGLVDRVLARVLMRSDAED